MLFSIVQGQKDLQNSLTFSITGLTSTSSHIPNGTTIYPNNQPSSSNALPSQPLPNPKGDAITLRSENTLPERSPEEPSSRENIHVEDIVEVEDVEEEDEVQDAIEEEVVQPRNGVPKEHDVVRESIPNPFSYLARRTKKQVELDSKMVEIFKKVEVTIPLFDAIRQVPKYEDLCMNKDKIHDLETIPLGSSISALMGAITEKCGDPGPCMVTYKSIISVVGITEDFLVSIKGLTFPIDFYILEMPSNDPGRPSSILLGRPFLKTSRFKLDAFSGTYSIEIDGRAVSFNLDEAMKHPPEDHSIFQCDIIDETVAEVHQEAVEELNMEQGASVGKPSAHNEDTLPPPIAPNDQVLSHELKMELKPLPPQLKYAYLKDNKKIPVIIARELTSQQEEQLLSVLRRHKKAIG
ncbi:uncharacterized protein LOC130966072 [Arachis stenosperma]|uniref:uncharacterized protein LOC130966072 n=1 Tax=Arachis stenosperma TaxID=217475 RepID=UPI0025ACA4A7|nr:uncharacterized protein LOC130966072 [Arachis stenosperma]